MNCLQQLSHCFAALSIFVTLPALAADADNGKRLALARCTGCHIIAPNHREEVADSPPFETIGRKFGFNSELLVTTILAPHPKMNLMLKRSEADDIAAYIGSLAK